MTMTPAANSTRNQHFVSQAEQRANAANPEAKPKKQRIHAFRLVNRDKLQLELEGQSGVLIEQNLSALDLFSFAVLGPQCRLNLEDAFQRHEQGVKAHTERLLRNLRLGDQTHLKSDVVDLVVAKVLNYFRNPYSVPKVLNTLGASLHEPQLSDPALATAYEAFSKGNRPQRADLCRQFALTEEEYDGWLRALVLLVSRPSSGVLSIFELVLKDLFEKSYALVHVFDYSAAPRPVVCVLSDRGFVIPAVENSTDVLFEFNLSSQAFLCVVFLDPETRVPRHFPHRAEKVALLRGRAVVTPVRNDLAALARYNTNAVYQCASRVYSASPHIEKMLLSTA
jgi:hypothetical protein